MPDATALAFAGAARQAELVRGREVSSRELVGAAQLVGRLNDEGTLLSLPAQVEAERPWADRRPAS